MDTICETLRRERVRQKLDFQKLSDLTKISARMLQAMENGDLSKLPGGVFTRSFFKQYGAALGLDPAYVEAEVRQLQPDTVPASAQPVNSFVPFESSEPGSNSLTAAGIWVILALAGCGGVYYFVRGYQAGTSFKPAPAAVERAKAPEKTAVAPPQQEQPASQPAPASQINPDAPAAVPLGSGTLQVVLNASEEAWVSVTVDGKQVFTGVLRPNDRREINAAEKVKVVTGNAGGLVISLNGKDLNTFGPRGQVRTVELTRAGAQVVSRTPKSEPLL